MVVGGHIDASTYKRICEDVAKTRPRALTKEERVDIIRMQVQLRHEQTMKIDSTGQGVSQRIATMLGRGRDTVEKVWKEYMNQQTIEVRPVPANRTNHPTRICKHPMVIADVQTYVRERRLTRTRTVARDVVDFMQAKGLVGEHSIQASGTDSGF
ncbi:hypothetical protein AC1031_015098 [Aphanomyces cochlioides]|nr:hypothetical protein AC1031_015098 [Aphanomyces cochlioides]